MLTILLLAVAAVSAHHNHHNPMHTAEDSRAGIKGMLINNMMESSQNSMKRSTAEMEAEDWMQLIQQAKRLVNRKLGSEAEPRDDGLWQGDIVLTREQAAKIITDNGGKLPQSMQERLRRGKRSVEFYDGGDDGRWQWPIKYVIDNTLTSGPHATAGVPAKIEKTIAAIQAQLPCLQFQRVYSYSSADYVMKFGVDSQTSMSCGGYAFIGRVSPTTNGVGNYVQINVGATWCAECQYMMIITHEIFHSLGLSHEQCRGDRDKFITINWNNIDSSQKHNFDQDSNNTFTNYGQAYNYYSVMHYGATTFALNSNQNSMTPIQNPSVLTKVIGSVCGANASDITILRNAYCKNPSVLAPSSKNNHAFGPYCFRGTDKTACQAASKGDDPATCDSGYTAGAVQSECFKCDGNCGTPVAGDGAAAVYYRSLFASKGGSLCGSSSPWAWVKLRTCTSSTKACVDSDAMCGWKAILGQCTQAATKTACPKSCNDTTVCSKTYP